MGQGIVLWIEFLQVEFDTQDRTGNFSPTVTIGDFYDGASAVLTITEEWVAEKEEESIKQNSM